MNEFKQKGNVSDEDFMIHVLNNLPEEYDVILDGLENHLTATRDDALTIDSIRKKFNHRYKKIERRKSECQRCGKYGHKPGNQRCSENKNEKEENDKKIECKYRKFDGICYH